MSGANRIPVERRPRSSDYNDRSAPPPQPRASLALLPPPPSSSAYAGAGGGGDYGSSSGVSSKRSRFEDAPPQSSSSGGAEGGEERRKRRSRWGDEQAKVFLPGIPTIIPKGMSPLQMDEFVVKMRLEEIGRKLRMNDVLPHEKDRRSVSPEPIYGGDGKRINTREYRYRKKLEDERHKLVDDALRRFPGFILPADYKKPSKLQDKLYLPAKDYPELNFIGLLIGPRGNTLKKMEADSGAKISIRGKGSIKVGKVRLDGQLAPGEEEELHCLITADSKEKIMLAMKHINKVIET
ncbi:Splicing factor 1, partial [Cladochytrium tenue]